MKKNVCRIGYNPKNDAFDFLISTDGGETWGLEVECPCVFRRGEKPTDEAEYIHIDIIGRLKDAIRNGFEVVY